MGSSKDSTSISKGMKSRGNVPRCTSASTPSSSRILSHTCVRLGMKKAAMSWAGPCCLQACVHEPVGYFSHLIWGLRQVWVCIGRRLLAQLSWMHM